MLVGRRQTTITIDDELVAYVDSKINFSAWVNLALKKEKAEIETKRDADNFVAEEELNRKINALMTEKTQREKAEDEAREALRINLEAFERAVLFQKELETKGVSHSDLSGKYICMRCAAPNGDTTLRFRDVDYKKVLEHIEHEHKEITESH